MILHELFSLLRDTDVTYCVDGQMPPPYTVSLQRSVSQSLLLLGVQNRTFLVTFDVNRKIVHWKSGQPVLQTILEAFAVAEDHVHGLNFDWSLNGTLIIIIIIIIIR